MAFTVAPETTRPEPQPSEPHPTGSMSIRMPYRPPRMQRLEGQARDDVKGRGAFGQPNYFGGNGYGPTYGPWNRITSAQLAAHNALGHAHVPPEVKPPFSLPGCAGQFGTPQNSSGTREPIQGPREYNFKAWGIDAYPTRAQRKEICWDFISLRRTCQNSNKCVRIHPKNSAYFRRKLHLRESLELFGLDRSGDRPQLGLPSNEVESTPAALPLPGASDDDSESTLSRTNSTEMKSDDCTVESSIMRETGWNSSTGDWEFGLKEDAWLSSDMSSSSSESSSHELRNFDHRDVASETENDGEEVDDRSNVLTPREAVFQEPCRNFQAGRCTRGPLCRYSHTSVKPYPVPSFQDRRQGANESSNGGPAFKEDAPTQIPSVQSISTVGSRSMICLDWHHGRCSRGSACRFKHPDPESTPKPPTHTIAVRYQRPPFNVACKHWLRGECTKGHLCNYLHGDLAYDDSIPPRTLIQVPPRTAPEEYATTIYKHVKIKVTDGFEILEVVTGFESSWIYVGNVPKRVRQEELSKLLKKHGELMDLRVPNTNSGPFLNVKARFSNPKEASSVCSAIDGLEAFGSTLTARLSVSADRETGLNDTSVRIAWEAPGKTAYIGFPSKIACELAHAKIRQSPLRDHFLKASPHAGLPAVGLHNLRLDGVPVEVDTEELKAFSGADGVMWGSTNYTSHKRALNGIQRMVKEPGVDLLDFELVPPPYKGGMVVAWAHFATAGDAKKLCEHMHARKPGFTGNTRIYARHIQSLEYCLPHDTYGKVDKDINALAATASRMGHFTVTCRPRPSYVTVRLGAEDTQGLSKLKAELDVILAGEVVRDQGKVVWDRFFAHFAGENFISQLQQQYSPLTIRVDVDRKLIRLFGSSPQRLEVKTKILEQVDSLRKQKVSTIPLDSWTIGAFLNEGFNELKKELGEDCIQIDLWNRSLSIRGDEHAYITARDAVIRSRRSRHQDPIPTLAQCPVCCDTATAPVTLCCGHSWCTTCFVRYVVTSVDLKFFPLTCLGDEGKCQERIPLHQAKQLLPASDFEAVIEAAFSTHIHQRPNEFSYCPTPDCQQVYRPIPRRNRPRPSNKAQSRSASPSASPSTTVSVGTVLQCPSCLVRICASCQTEAHDGLACVRPDEGDGLFDEWMKKNDVKPCPGCKMPIEKDMGCHHVTCAVCSIHLCWLCLMPFQNGAGVYSHMLAIHGSFV